MRFRTIASVVTGVVVCVMLAHAQNAAPDCKPAGTSMRLEALPEASGLATSGIDERRLWLNNDSGKAELIAVDREGKTLGRVAIDGATNDDWEALASGRCGEASCLFIGDIGDNDADRAHVTIYRVREPAKVEGSVKAEALRATYPDGAQDAEALLVAPDGRLHIVTKGETGRAALYRFPRELSAGATSTLERVGQLSDRPLPRPRRITDGAVSADGKWLALRTLQSVMLYPAADFFSGTFKAARTIDVSGLGEPQGEAIAFDRAGTMFLAGEGGGKKQPGTLATLPCGK